MVHSLPLGLTLSSPGLAFVCPTCNRSLKSRPVLMKHMKLHDRNRKIYDCQLCSYTCNFGFNLKRHIATVHARQAPLATSPGSNTTLRRESRELKIISPKAIKQEIVDEVEDEFLTRYNSFINNMQSSVQGKTDFTGSANRNATSDNQCPICKKSYSTKHSMRRHMLMHKPFNRRFECVICQKMFNWPGNLRTHLQTIHQMRPEEFEFKNYKFPEPEEIILEASAAGNQ
ncbi:ras-responsive element-binding protein 1-like [Galendromus occidentalis]|uniref:Ras-responsive element-binding protein 1-like n=1 Tax=Galendromus occidentalis TaxID=34638 RepID=A0AAJ6QYZ5_9ACAR|nr:ras-responsive element-binding protein 1-like [Galendromus occidentalis]